MKVNQPWIGEEEKKAVLDVLESGEIGSGEKVREFEKRFSSYIKTKHGIATSNGTTALDVMLKAAGVKGEVIIPSFGFVATANAVLYQNAIPVFADVGEDFNLSYESVEKALSRKTKAIILVHMFGKPVNLKPFIELGEDKGILIFEDASQAHGARYRNNKVGSFGIASSFSFYISKNITCGEGGMVLTDDDEIAKLSRMLINHGQSERYKHEILGFNYRMGNINAAIGIEQLKKLEFFNERRRENANYLNSKLKGINGIIIPKEDRETYHVYNQYVIRIKEEYGKTREELAKELKENGIKPTIPYPIPIHEQPLCKKLNIKPRVRLENTEMICREALSLPIHPLVNKEALDKIVEVIRSS